MKAMIFAAGLGTRLKPFTDHSPKALAEVNGKSLLHRTVTYLQQHGIYDVVINIHHFPHLMREAIATHNGYGSRITISDETSGLLETGGGLKKATPLFEGEHDIVVINVDILTSLDLTAMITAHRQNNALATLAVMQRPSSRQLLFNPVMELRGWINNNTGECKEAGNIENTTPWSFSGIQIVSSTLLHSIPFEGKFSMIDVYLWQAARGIVKGYNHTGDIFIDVGKPGSVEQAEQLFP